MSRPLALGTSMVLALLTAGALLAPTGADDQPAAKGAAESVKHSAPAAINGPTGERADETAIQRALLQRTSVHIEDLPLEDALASLVKTHQLQLHVEKEAIAEQNATVLATPVTLNLHGARLRSVLNLLLEPLQLAYAIRDEMLVITTESRRSELLESRIYDVRNLVVSGDSVEVIEAITSCIEPDTWDEVGGPGSIRAFKNGIAVRQTDAVHDQISRLLSDVDAVISRDGARAGPPRLSDPIAKSEAAIYDLLRARSRLDCSDRPLNEVLAGLATTYGLPLWSDTVAISDEGLGYDTPVTLHVEDIRLESLLNTLLRPHELTWLVEDEVLKITTRAKSCERLVTRVYDVADLLKADDAPRTWPPPQIRNRFLGMGIGGGFFDVDGTVLRQGFGQGNAAGVQPMGQITTMADKYCGNDELIEVLTSTVEPDSWDEVGGPGSLRSLNGALVVRQTRAVHREIQTRLDQMRRVALAEDKKDERVKDAKAPKEEDPAALKLVVYPLGHYPAADLGRAIPEFVVPESWKAAGGKGTIHAVQGALIVRQTRAVHTAIVDLLYQLPIWEAAPPIVPGAPATPPAGNPNPTPAKPEEKK